MKKQGFLYGSAILVASALITKVIGALFKIPLANMLGGTGMGYFGCAYGLFMPIYAISVTGLPTAVAKLTAENAAHGRLANVRKIKRIALLLFSMIGVVSGGLLLALARPFSGYVVETPDALPSVLLIAPSIFFGCVMAVYRGYYEGLRNMFPTAVSQVAEALVKLASGLVLCYFTLELANDRPQRFLELAGYLQDTQGLRAEDLALPYAAAAAVLGVTLSSLAGMLFLILRHKIAGDGITQEELVKDKTTDSGRRLVSQLMKILVPVAIGSVVTNLTALIDLGTIVRCLNTSVEKAPEYFVGMGVPMEDMATFIYGSFTGLTLTVFNLVPSFTNMFGKGILPNLTEAWSVRDQKRIHKSVESVILVTGLIAIPSGLGITALSREILEFLFSSRTVEIMASWRTLSALGLGVIFLSLTAPVFAMLQAIGRADLPVKIMLAGVAVKLAGNLLLIPIPELNIVGAGISTMFSYALICALAIHWLCKLTHVKLNTKKVFFKPAYAGILCAGGALTLYIFLENTLGNHISLVMGIAFGGLIYLIALVLLGGITKDEIKSVFRK